VGLRLICKVSDDCQADLDAIEAERAAVRALIPEELEYYFARQARIFSTHASAAIDGNEVEPDQAASIAERAVVPQGEQELEIYNLTQAYDLAYQLSQDRSVGIDSGTIRSLNAVLQQDATSPDAAARGTYRQPVDPETAAEAAVETGEERNSILYEPPASEDVSDLMAEFVQQIGRWLDRRPGPVAAALTHFGLLSIRPFESANGRTARLLADMVLDQTGWSEDRMLSLSSAIHDSGGVYLAVLRSTQGPRFRTRVDASPFVEYHTKQLRRAMDQLRQSAVGLNQLMDELGTTTDFDREQMLLLWYLAVIGPISSAAYASLIGKSQDTAIEKLLQASDAGLLKKIAAGQSTRYDLTERVWRRAQGD
jgi:Fic family protein